MVPEIYTKPYIDSSVWIGWIKEEGNLKGINRKDVFDHILLQAQRGDFLIYTSAATLAEVHKRRGQDHSLTTKQDEDILEFFEHSYIRLIEVNREIGEAANRLCRDISLSPTGASIKPFDAIHLASALSVNCDYLLCWDETFAGFVHPKIKIEEPRKLGQSMITFEP